MSVLRPCTWCGKEFTPTRSDGLFHSKSCKQAYWRWKHKIDFIASQVYQGISEIEQYLENDATRQHAENILGATADRLAAMGFEASDKQIGFAEETYTLTNETGE